MFLAKDKLVEDDNNVLLFGDNKNSKINDFVCPNIKSMDCNYIIFDFNAKLVDYLAPELAKQGYSIKVLNLIDQQYTSLYNPFTYIKSNKEIEQFASFITQDNKEKILLLLTMFIIFERNDSKELNICQLKNILDAELPFGKLDDFLNDLIRSIHDDNAIAYQYFNKFKQFPETVKIAVWNNLKNKINNLVLTTEKPYSTLDTMYLDKLHTEKMAVFVLANTSFNEPLIQILYWQISNIVNSMVFSKFHFKFVFNNFNNFNKIQSIFKLNNTSVLINTNNNFQQYDFDKIKSNFDYLICYGSTDPQLIQLMKNSFDYDLTKLDTTQCLVLTDEISICDKYESNTFFKFVNNNFVKKNFNIVRFMFYPIRSLYSNTTIQYIEQKFNKHLKK